METKYKGYEDLLDVDEHDPNIFIPSDVQGSVRALKYALAHPLVFSEPQGTYKERRIEKTKVRPFLRIFGFEKLGTVNFLRGRGGLVEFFEGSLEGCMTPPPPPPSN